MNTLHLILKRKWYDMIVSGEKPEEYREKKAYWANRFLCQPSFGCGIKNTCKHVKESRVSCDRYTHVCLHCGYTRTIVEFEIESITTGIGNTEWGAPENKEVFIIKFGKRTRESSNK